MREKLTRSTVTGVIPLLPCCLVNQLIPDVIRAFGGLWGELSEREVEGSLSPMP